MAFPGQVHGRVQDQLREYTKAHPGQDTMVRNLLAHELDTASNGDFHRHKAARSRLIRWLGDALNRRPPTLPDTL